MELEFRAGLNKAASAHNVTAETLEEFILAHEPPPDDVEAADDVDDEERLRFMESAYYEVDRQASSMMMDGEGKFDGWTVDQWRDAARSAYEDLEHERRRQAAVKRFPHVGGPVI